MGTLKDQLLAKGLVTQEAADRAERNKRRKQGPSGQANVRTTREFLDSARELLLDDPTKIDVVLESAHRFKGSGNEKEKRLYWICYEVKRRLPKLGPNDQKALIKRAFRKNNPTPTLPGEPKK